MFYRECDPIIVFAPFINGLTAMFLYLTVFYYLAGMNNVKCHEKFKRCIKKVQKSGKPGFSNVCPLDVVVPVMDQGMDMAIMFSQFGNSKLELWLKQQNHSTLEFWFSIVIPWCNYHIISKLKNYSKTLSKHFLCNWQLKCLPMFFMFCLVFRL